MGSPLDSILLGSSVSWVNSGEHRRQQIPGRDHDEVGKTWLLLRHYRRLPIAEEGSWHFIHLLNVTLVEELLE